MMVPNITSTGSGAGVPGPRGPEGKSTYELAVGQGYEGTLDQWLLTQIGPEGPKGDDGDAGPQGLKGDKGDKGDAGTGLTNRGAFVLGATYNPSDYVFATGTSASSSMFISQAASPFVSAAQPKDDLTSWVEFSAPAGANGVDGTNGVDGKSVELQKAGSAVQWRQTGGAWADLIALADITGPQGPAGDTGQQGPKGNPGDAGAKGDAGLTGAAGRDGIDGANYFVSGMATIALPSTVTAIRVGGYYASGDGGAGLYVVAASQPSHAGKFQTADARWWELQSDGQVHAAQFGAKAETGFNNATALNNATDFLVTKGGGIINHGAGEFGLAGVVTLKSRVIHRGVGRRVTKFVRIQGYLGDLFKTLDFDTLYTGDTAGGPNRFGLECLMIDGKKSRDGATATGWNIRIYGRAYYIREVDSDQCCAGGFYSRWGSTSAAWDNDNTDSVMEASVDGLFVQFAKQWPVFDGPHDSQFTRMIVAMSRHDQAALSGSSSFEIGSRASGSQFGLLHVWGDSPEWAITNYATGISIADLVVDDARPNGGLLKQLGNNCWIQGRGLQFGTDSLKGIQLGQSGTTIVSGNRITMSLTCTPLTAIDFSADGGNDIFLSVNAPTATVNFAGTRHADTVLTYSERGAGAGANDYLSVFGALQINKQSIQLAGRSGTPNDVGWAAGLLYFDSAMGKLRLYRSGAWYNLAFEA